MLGHTRSSAILREGAVSRSTAGSENVLCEHRVGVVKSIVLKREASHYYEAARRRSCIALGLSRRRVGYRRRGLYIRGQKLSPRHHHH